MKKDHMFLASSSNGDLYGNAHSALSLFGKDPNTLGQCVTAPNLACGDATDGPSIECYVQNECLPITGHGRLPGSDNQFHGKPGLCAITNDPCTVGTSCATQARCASREELEREGHTLPTVDTSQRCFQGLFCENGGSCVSGECQCPEGFEGWTCGDEKSE